MRTSTKLAFACLTALYGSSLHAADQTASGPIGAPQDWSSRVIIHHKPLTPDEFEAAGRTREMAAAYRDPRYVASVLRRVEAEGRREVMPMAASARMEKPKPRNPHEDRHRPRKPGNAVASPRDWSNVLGGLDAGAGMEGTYPAKYNFDITAAPSCTGDFIVYPVATPAASSSGTSEYQDITFSAPPNENEYLTLGVGSRSVTLTVKTTPTTNTQFARGANAAATAAALAAAINLWKGQTGFAAEDRGGGVVRISRIATGNDAADIPGDANFSNVSYGTVINGSGTPGQPSVVAFNQLYQGAGACNGSWNANGAVKAPRVMWAYNTGTGYINETSPSLSYLDGGKQVAYVQRNGGTLQLVLLKWQDGQGTVAAPATPTLSASAAAYRACTGNCYYTFTFQTGGKDTPTWSSPFVDYANDILWVGDTQGQLHKFTNVFQGTPAMVTTGGFPVTVASGMKLGSPASDGTNVYVGSQSGSGSVGGKLHRVVASSGALASSAKLAVADSTGIRETVIIDTATNNVFAFLFNDGTAGNNLDCSPTDPGAGNFDACRVVARFARGFANNALPLQRTYVGRGNSRVSTLFAGAFDDAYYSGGGEAGAMYIVGGRPGDTYYPTLWKIPFTTGGEMLAPVQGPQVGVKSCTVAQPACSNDVWNWSPVTVIKNPNTNAERLFFSMPKDGNAAGCTGACVYMYDLNQTWGTSMTAAAGFAMAAGTSGIVVDNVRPTAEVGTSQIYFSQLDAAIRKQWTLTFTANVFSGDGRVRINNSVNFTAGSTTSCTSAGGTFNANGGSAKDDAIELRSCLLAANLANFDISGENGSSNGSVVITYSAKGNPADNLVTENIGNVTLAITQGTASTAGNAVQVSQSALD